MQILIPKPDTTVRQAKPPVRISGKSLKAMLDAEFFEKIALPRATIHIQYFDTTNITYSLISDLDASWGAKYLIKSKTVPIDSNSNEIDVLDPNGKLLHSIRFQKGRLVFHDPNYRKPLIYKKLGAKAEQEFKDSLETKKSTDVLTARPVGGWEIFNSGLANKIYETDPTAEGKLKIRLVVDSSGKVTKTKVVEGFNEEANKTIIQTIEKTKFHPSRKNGKVQEMSTSLVMMLQKRG